MIFNLYVFDDPFQHCKKDTTGGLILSVSGNDVSSGELILAWVPEKLVLKKTQKESNSNSAWF
ncbi:MAG: hypothetical protein B6I22_03520 [Desulfobacteraceae bacterium 4572_123]|nr:MAG: hypothetical protein B6I22_03520 [Desulfobacteraceae bacterium 4572_123]